MLSSLSAARRSSRGALTGLFLSDAFDRLPGTEAQQGLTARSAARARNGPADAVVADPSLWSSQPLTDGELIASDNSVGFLRDGSGQTMSTLEGAPC